MWNKYLLLLVVSYYYTARIIGLTSNLAVLVILVSLGEIFYHFGVCGVYGCGCFQMWGLVLSGFIFATLDC